MWRARMAIAAFALAASTAAAQEQAPPSEAPASAPANPHGGGTQMFQPPPDSNDDDPRLPAGSISIAILDPDNKPIAGIPVTLGILHQSVAKGESREHKVGTTDASGVISFADLEKGSGIAYRVSVVKDGGTFWAMPFMLPLDKGERVQLHVYPVTHDIGQALIVSQVAMAAEMKDDRVQIEEAITIYNLGRTAWVPSDLVVALPPDFTAFNAQQSMSDQGLDPIDKRGAKLRGTFGPGQHTLDFRWQLPYAGETNVTMDVGLPPHVAIARVIAAASQQMRLVVSGFPEAEPQTSQQGERLLVTEKQMRRDEPPLTKVHVELRDLPTQGPGRYVATLLAAIGILGGLGYAFSARRERPVSTGKDLRASLLAELEDLERAHRAGDIGPKTYERARRELIDAIARTLAPADASGPSATKSTA